MPKPRALGSVANAITSSSIERLAENERSLFDAVISIYGGNKDGAVQALKVISDNNTVALQALTLMRAGEMQAAEELLMGARSRQLAGGN